MLHDCRAHCGPVEFIERFSIDLWNAAHRQEHECQDDLPVSVGLFHLVWVACEELLPYLSNAEPDADFLIGIRVAAEAQLELLECWEDQSADCFVGGSCGFELLVVERLAADRPRLRSPISTGRSSSSAIIVHSCKSGAFGPQVIVRASNGWGSRRRRCT